MEKSEIVLAKLASVQGRKDEEPNIELAEEIASTCDEAAVGVLINHLDGKKEIRRDCIKTLYEIGERQPDLIAHYLEAFLPLLQSKDNRMQWGGMSAISSMAGHHPLKVYRHLPKIMAAAEVGSVITRDHAVKTLVKVGTHTEHREEIFQMLHEILIGTPVNQFASYVEETLAIIDEAHRDRFIQTIKERLPEMNTEAKKKRLLKVLKKLQ